MFFGRRLRAFQGERRPRRYRGPCQGHWRRLCCVVGQVSHCAESSGWLGTCYSVSGKACRCCASHSWDPFPPFHGSSVCALSWGRRHEDPRRVCLCVGGVARGCCAVLVACAVLSESERAWGNGDGSDLAVRAPRARPKSETTPRGRAGRTCLCQSRTPGADRSPWQVRSAPRRLLPWAGCRPPSLLRRTEQRRQHKLHRGKVNARAHVQR